MHTEILTIGDELITGTLVDTNSAYIAEQCEKHGLEVIQHQSIGDDLEKISSTLAEISTRADIVIVSGGLGPTLDDLTRNGAANAAGVSLVLNDIALEEIENYFAKRGREMPDANTRQAYFPDGAEYLPNPIGTAPGFTLKINKAVLFFTPGVPSEMKRMLNEQIFPRILLAAPALEKLTIKTFATFGLSEAIIGKHLENIAKSFPEIKFGTRAKWPDIELKLYLRDSDHQKASLLLSVAEQAVNTTLSQYIFSYFSESIETVIGRLLIENNATLAILEYNQGGMITDMLTNNLDTASCLLFSCVLNPSLKTSILAGSKNILTTSTGEVAKYIRNLSSATYGLVIHASEEETDIDQPSSTIIEIVIAEQHGITSYSLPVTLGHNIQQKKSIFSMLALDLLRRHILQIEIPDEFLGKKITISKVNV